MGLQTGSKLGATQIERLRLSREQRPELTIAAHEQQIIAELMVLPGEGWSYSRHAKEKVQSNAAGYHGLRKCVVILAAALDLHRTKGAEQSRAFLSQAYKAAQSAALHPQKQWGFGWPLLGIPDPDGVSRPGYTPAETSALAAWHRDFDLLSPHLTGASSSKGATSGGGGTIPHAGSAEAENKKLKADLAKVQAELAEERKKTKGKGKGKGGKDSEPPP